MDTVTECFEHTEQGDLEQEILIQHETRYDLDLRQEIKCRRCGESIFTKGSHRCFCFLCFDAQYCKHCMLALKSIPIEPMTNVPLQSALTELALQKHERTKDVPLEEARALFHSIYDSGRCNNKICALN